MGYTFIYSQDYIYLLCGLYMYLLRGPSPSQRDGIRLHLSRYEPLPTAGANEEPPTYSPTEYKVLHKFDYGSLSCQKVLLPLGPLSLGA